ncbi:MAG: hypothetical protein RIS94_1702, partial [Pseudomonadota bacterium]
MAEAAETIICISANGNTSSSSRMGARRMLVATANGVLDFRRTGPDAEWTLLRDDILAGKHVSSL